MSPLAAGNPEAGFNVGDTDATAVVAAAGAIDFPNNVPARKARVKSHSIVILTAPTEHVSSIRTHINHHVSPSYQFVYYIKSGIRLKFTR